MNSLDGICEVLNFHGRSAQADSPPDVMIELPHGATQLAHLHRAKALTSEYPGDRHDLFFTANTDQGSPEYAYALAEMLVAALPTVKVTVLRCLLPRTIVDVNRVWSLNEEAGAAGLTLGVPHYIQDPGDLARIQACYDAYQNQAREGYDRVCGHGGFALNLHTYAPISVTPEPGEYIVDTLIRAYRPDMVGTWPVRPVVELITAPPDGPVLAPPALSRRLIDAYAAIGIQALENEPFPLHPTTTAYVHAARHPGRTITIELSRAALAQTYDPFAIMTICPEKVERMTRPIADAFLAFLKHDAPRSGHQGESGSMP